jgi:hypothetical protein
MNDPTPSAGEHGPSPRDHVCVQSALVWNTLYPCTRQRDGSLGEDWTTGCCPDGFPKFV